MVVSPSFENAMIRSEGMTFWKFSRIVQFSTSPWSHIWHGNRTKAPCVILQAVSIMYYGGPAKLSDVAFTLNTLAPTVVTKFARARVVQRLTPRCMES